MQKLNLFMGRDAIFDLVRSNGLLIRIKRRHIYTTDSCHRFKIYPDLVQRRAATKAEEIWVSDITYIRIGDSFGFLSLVTDAYSRKIMGYYLAKDLKVTGCIEALNNAIGQRDLP